MRKIILVACLCMVCIAANAGLLSGLAKAAKEVAEHTSSLVRKADSKNSPPVKKDAENISKGTKLEQDLDFIGSSKFKVGPEDFLRAGKTLKNAHGIRASTGESSLFYSWLKLKLATTSVRNWANSFSDEINSELEHDALGAELGASDEKSKLTADTLHQSVLKELKTIEDSSTYIEAISEYFFVLATFGWIGFDPVEAIEYDKLGSITWSESAQFDIAILAIAESMGRKFEAIETQLGKDMATMSESDEISLAIESLTSCIAFTNWTPGAARKPWPMSEALYRKYCSPSNVVSLTERFLQKADGPSDSLAVASINAVASSLLSPWGNDPKYVAYRDKVMVQIPRLIERESDLESMGAVLLLLAMGELSVGNAKNAYDISILGLQIAGNIPVVRNGILGFVLPSIFIEAEDILMTRKLIEMMKVMSNPKSQFFIPAESKTNLIAAITMFKILVSSQSI